MAWWGKEGDKIEKATVDLLKRAERAVSKAKKMEDLARMSRDVASRMNELASRNLQLGMKEANLLGIGGKLEALQAEIKELVAQERAGSARAKRLAERAAELKRQEEAMIAEIEADKKENVTVEKLSKQIDDLSRMSVKIQEKMSSLLGDVLDDQHKSIGDLNKMIEDMMEGH